jgi:RNA polymerase sigma-70 factor (ECF subfamily)
MATTMRGVLRHMHRAVQAPDAADAELLGRFVEDRDEHAFAVLLHRHGPMVLGVCRRVLRNDTDAEDAFQATFLVLVVKAHTVYPRERVGNWLYGVAHNTARKAKTMNARRHDREATAVDRRQAREEPEYEVLALLDAELRTLPDRYRTPIVLCDLEGRTLAEAAAHLGWPQGTVATRLRRGRHLLARKLSRHGVALSAALLVLADVPSALAASTLNAARLVSEIQAVTPGVASATVTALTQGVLRSMTRSTLATMVVVLGVLLCGLGGALALCGPIPDPPPRGPDPKPGDAKQKATDAEKLQGIWTGEIAELGGQPWAENDKERGKVQVRIKGDTLTLRATIALLPGIIAFGNSPADTTFAFKVDENKKRIDLAVPQADDDVKALDALGLYALDGETLTLCLNSPNKKRPEELKTKERTGQMLFVLKRDPKATWEALPKPPEGIPQPNEPTRP